jgi:leader peptidase (prepilin peptidase) / N-methyltransferase
MDIVFIVGIIASVIDIKKKCIPNWLIIFGGLVTITACFIFSPSSICSCALISLSFFAIFLCFCLLQKKGLGMGDVKFITLISFSFAIVGTWIVLTTSCLLALAWALWRYLSQRNKQQAKKQIPFAPFLTLGMAFALFAKYKQLW